MVKHLSSIKSCNPLAQAYNIKRRKKKEGKVVTHSPKIYIKLQKHIHNQF